MQVSELMSPHVVTVAPEDSCAVAARLLHRYNIGALPVCSKEGRLRGIVTDRDIVLRCVAADTDPRFTSVKEVMSRGLACVSPQDDARAATQKMAYEQVRRLPVVDGGGQLVGMLSLGDMAKAGSCGMEAAQALSEISGQIKGM